jgi:cellulose synthase/poly-beta-1,6-N-acetylglucosamine synthase-like glycosyltransferase
VVIPVARPDARTQRCLAACAALTYEPRTILVVTERAIALPADAHFVNVVTGSDYVTSPAEKRDLATTALPDVDAYAYLDDDAYPPPDWLDRIADTFAQNPQAAGAGGPGLMPDDQRFWERVSAAVMETRLGSGPLRFRFWQDAPRWCDDFPAYDLAIRKAWLDKVGGWATDWYGGEDTVLCARLADAGGLIRYDPSIAVRHYRRRLVPDHFWQIQNVGRSRGCFVRSGNPRFRKWTFAGPPMFVLFVLALAFSPLWWRGHAIDALVGLAAIYATVALFAHPGKPDWRVRLVLPIAIVVHHAAYTAGLIRGLVTGRRRRTRRSLPSST